MRPTQRRRSLEESDSASHTHVTPFSLAAELDASEGEQALVVHGRVSRCHACRSALETLTHWLAVLDHWRPAVGPEFLTRHGFYGELLATSESHAERLERARTEGLFHHWGLCRLLVEESRRMRSRDPRFSVELGELGYEIGARLDEEYYSAAWVADLRAQSACELADSLRRFGRRDLAEERLRRSRGWLASGTGRETIRAQVDWLEALLLRDEGREREAWLLVERSMESRDLGTDLPAGAWLVDPRRVAASGR